MKASRRWLAAALVTAGCLAPRGPLDLPRAGESARTVYVVGHGWHVGLVVRREDIPVGLWPEHADFGGASYVEVGWGDREFYRAPDAGFGLAVRAAVASSASVLHVIGLAAAPPRGSAGAEVVEIALSPRGLDALVRFIDAAHDRRDAPRVSPLGPGLYGDSRFYPATGTYHLLNTCNTWVARALRAAGCPTRPLWAATAGNALSQARACGRVFPTMALW